MAVASNKRPYETRLVVTAQFVRDNYLFGVNLQDDDGNEMPDSLIEVYIRSAQDWLQAQLPGILLFEREIKGEVHDYHINDYTQFSFLKTFRYPIQSVSSYAVEFPLSSKKLDFDPTWFRIDSTGGMINLVPTQGTFSSILLGEGGSFLPLLYTGREYVPGIIVVTYRAGFRSGQIPFQLVDLIAMKAAIGPLNIAGDLIAGAGIASKSISLDGLSQSVGTTSSATNAGYGARILQYEKQVKNILEGLQVNLTGIQMTVA
jgi:hypothetical protein